MEERELLKFKETVISVHEEPKTREGSLSKAEVEEIRDYRQRALQKIRGIVSLNLYLRIKEKLEVEKHLLERLLHWENTKQDVLSHYSFVLDPRYFEQKFFSNEI